MPLPALDPDGDLPIGVHPAALSEVVQRFGENSPRRRVIAARLERVCRLAWSTNRVARLIVFGSFITAKAEPNDVDVFLLMEDSFDASQTSGEVSIVFDHTAAQAYFGASIFWLRRMAALEGEDAAVEYWQIKRDGGFRGVIDVWEAAS
jgi:hypothetical protein